jgi:hypothetical protein
MLSRAPMSLSLVHKCRVAWRAILGVRAAHRAVRRSASAIAWYGAAVDLIDADRQAAQRAMLSKAEDVDDVRASLYKPIGDRSRPRISSTRPFIYLPPKK